jgi:hypothetical protein
MSFNNLGSGFRWNDGYNKGWNDDQNEAIAVRAQLPQQ